VGRTRLSFWFLLHRARLLKEKGYSKKERLIYLNGIITGAKYYYVEQG